MKKLAIFSQLPYSHHAYGIESSQNIIDYLNKVLPQKEFSYVVHKKYDTFKIDDARTVKSLQSEKTDKASLFILEFTIINSEAQNALLKVLEEPVADTYFILVFPNTKNLLPTLQSRLEIIAIQNSIDTKNEDTPIVVSDFMKMSLSDRFNLIKDITDKKKEPISKSDAVVFLNNLEFTVYNADLPHKKNILESIFNARAYLNRKGASNKMILDMIAIELENI